MFSSKFSAELRRVCWAASSLYSFISKSKTLLKRMLKQGLDPGGVARTLNEMIKHYELDFQRNNAFKNVILDRLF